MPAFVVLVEAGLARQLPLTEVFLGSLEGQPVGLVAAAREKSWARRRLTFSQKMEIHGHLVGFASSGYPRALLSVAREFGVAVRTLRTLAPHLCSEFSARYTANRRRIREAKMTWFVQKVDAYIRRCTDDQRVPTWCELSGTFRKPGILRERSRRDYAKAALRQGVGVLQRAPVQLDFFNFLTGSLGS
jgi:hypothetical protein